MNGEGETFGERLRQLREARRLSKKGLAEQAGVSAATVSKAEISARAPQRATTEKLARALGVAPDELRTGRAATADAAGASPSDGAGDGGASVVVERPGLRLEAARDTPFEPVALLFAQLPPPGDAWTEARRVRWLAAVDAALRWVYDADEVPQ